VKAIDAIRLALRFGDNGMKVLEDMSDDPLVQPGPWGGNHAMWIAGHITFIEGRLQKVLHGIPNPVERWKPLFDWGSEPRTDLTAYPPYDEVLQTYRRLRAQTVAFLDEVGEDGLDRPTKLPIPGFGPAFETVGPSIMVIACHQCGHLGGATVARRASGKKPTFVPSEEQRVF
jgi:DinB family protein